MAHGRQTIENKIIDGLADMLWWCAYADTCEAHGHTDKIRGQDVSKVAPPTPTAALHYARKVRTEILAANNAPSLTSLLRRAYQTDNAGADEFFQPALEASWGKYSMRYAREFGEKLAHQALGDGVRWADDHEAFYLCVNDGMTGCGDCTHVLGLEVCRLEGWVLDG